MGFCDTCQQETVWEDLTTGTYCTACGGEISALNFDESAEWIESGNGSAHQAGTTIATGSTGASALRGLAGAQSESRPQTIARAKRAVEELADKMQMNSLKRDAEGLIEMAVNNYFTKYVS
jgi:transcription initiation factor TFIIIB Brf1 subunit/transcription initiation factor TFIIB